MRTVTSLTFLLVLWVGALAPLGAQNVLVTNGSEDCLVNSAMVSCRAGEGGFNTVPLSGKIVAVRASSAGFVVSSQKNHTWSPDSENSVSLVSNGRVQTLVSADGDISFVGVGSPVGDNKVVFQLLRSGRFYVRTVNLTTSAVLSELGTNGYLDQLGQGFWGSPLRTVAVDWAARGTVLSELSPSGFRSVVALSGAWLTSYDPQTGERYIVVKGGRIMQLSNATIVDAHLLSDDATLSPTVSETWFLYVQGNQVFNLKDNSVVATSTNGSTPQVATFGSRAIMWDGEKITVIAQ